MMGALEELLCLALAIYSVRDESFLSHVIKDGIVFKYPMIFILYDY